MEIPDFLLDITDKTQLVKRPLPPDIVQDKIINQEYINTLESFWQNKGLITYYQRGILLGNGDINNVNFKEFLKKFKKLLEEIIRDELIINNKTTEQFKDDFKVLEHVFNMIITHLSNEKIVINNIKYLAIVQGFINSYINTIKHD